MKLSISKTRIYFGLNKVPQHNALIIAHRMLLTHTNRPLSHAPTDPPCPDELLHFVEEQNAWQSGSGPSKRLA